MKVLDSQEATILLGREFLRKFGSVTFDFDQENIRLGRLCIPIKAAMMGGVPIFRAETAMRDETIVNIEEVRIKVDINQDLDIDECEEISRLCHAFSDRFAKNPKRPQQTHKEKHYIITGDSTSEISSPEVPAKLGV